MEHKPDPAAIHLNGVSAGYAGTLVLYEVTATIPRAQVTALIGPNGSGKSTLLSVLAGVLSPQAGQVRRTISDRPAFVVQHTAVPTTLPLTVRETVAMGRWGVRGPWRRLKRADHELVAACMARVGIADLASRRLDSLSGGQRQRALLAQALAQESQLLLLDEPAAGLDSEAQEAISIILTEISAEGVTVVQATHDLDDARRATHCLHLRNGRLIAEGTPYHVIGRHLAPTAAT
ncbi:zinc ABC transporter ATP-binding protein AztA [Nocardia sp. XZ_19_385]|uniref:zinc ABC transporter ATP-binding protein AztA n=1 Tax=Nocardia sp. XZ_19_385 TaxID=2769488 RepID=UPI001890A1BB|nr:zinc ABC transporter ATP-binding protein AztA [Nocardia sp. XZ_19_385]